MSDYISKSAVIKQLSEVDDEIVKGCIGVIQTQPAISETDIIRKAFERVIERLESERATESFKALKNANETFIKGCIDNRVFAYSRAIKIIKEECGINE